MVNRVNQFEQQSITVLEDLLVMLLNPQSGYFYQVAGWNMNCAAIGAVLAELSLLFRIDTDLEKLIVLDSQLTGKKNLDFVLKTIAASPVERSTGFWIENLAVSAGDLIDNSLSHLVEKEILTYHEGEFWTPHATSQHRESIEARIREAIFMDNIPDPREAIIISLINACSIFPYLYELDEEVVERIEFLCQVDLIGKFIADSVKQKISSPLLRGATLSKQIPVVPIHKLIFNRHLRTGWVPAFFSDIAAEYGPVFRIRAPFKTMTFLVGPQITEWAHRRGRMHLRSRDYFSDIERVYGASGLIPALDGADHFRLRKHMQPGISRKRVGQRLPELLELMGNFVADWKVGTVLQGTSMCRLMVNSQISPLTLSIDSQDIVEDLIKFKERALTTHVAKILPKFLLHTSGMRKTFQAVNLAVERVQSTHTPVQRANCPVDLADDLLGLHGNDPQFMPQSNLKFALSAPLLASMYLGDALGFSLYEMANRPSLYDQIDREAQAIFADGIPDYSQINETNADVTVRFMRECLRLYPIIPLALRAVMNSAVVEGFELEAGQQVFVVQTASHYMDEYFPDPYKFDIDRYLPERNEHRQFAYCPYGWGTHRCLGANLLELLLTLNLLVIAYSFKLELTPSNYKIGFNPFPSMSPDSKLKFRVAELKRQIPV